MIMVYSIPRYIVTSKCHVLKNLDPTRPKPWVNHSVVNKDLTFKAKAKAKAKDLTSEHDEGPL